MLSTIGSTVPAIAMLAVFALVAAGGVLVVRRRDVRKGALMLVLAAVIFANVLILTV